MLQKMLDGGEMREIRGWRSPQRHHIIPIFILYYFRWRQADLFPLCRRFTSHVKGFFRSDLMHIRWIKRLSLFPACAGVPVTCTVAPGMGSNPLRDLNSLMLTGQSTAFQMPFSLRWMVLLPLLLVGHYCGHLLHHLFHFGWLLQVEKKREKLKMIAGPSAMQRDKGKSCKTLLLQMAHAKETTF